MPNRYTTLLFDMDGTLCDSKEGITKAVQYALRAIGLDVPDRNDLLFFIGPPMIETFQEYYHFDEATTRLAVKKYREYFSEKGLFDCALYPGIEDMLKRLKNAGYDLMVATSKPGVFAEQLLDKFAIRSYFSFVGGSNLDGSRVFKGEIIRYILENTSIGEPGNALMIGDRKQDVSGARRNGMCCLGAGYGYGSFEELSEAGTIYIAKTPAEIADYLHA